MLYRTDCGGKGLASLAPGGCRRLPRLRRGLRGLRPPHPMELGRGPGPATGAPRPSCPASGGASCGVLGLGPPRLRWAAAGLARRPCLRLGLAPGGAPGPCGAAGPARAPSAPLGSLRGSLRPIGGPPAPVGAGRLPPPAGAAAAAPVPAGGGLAPPPAAVPGSGVLAGGLLSLAAPLSGALRSCRLPACAPSSPLRVPLGRPLSGGPASAMGRRPSSLRGAAGAAAPPLPAAAAPLRGDYQPFGLPSRAAQVAHSGHP